MKLNLATIRRGLKVAETYVSKNSPVMLTGIAVTGVVATAWFAFKAGQKVTLVAEQLREKKGEEPSKAEVFAESWKELIPPVVTAAATIGCAIGAQAVNARRNAALASAYTLATETLKDYQDKTKSVVGPKKAGEIEEARTKGKYIWPENGEGVLPGTGKGSMACVDELTGQMFWSDPDEIRYVLAQMENQMVRDGSVSLNDIYFALGLRTSQIGSYFSYTLDDHGEIGYDFTSDLTENNVPILVLRFNDMPKYNFRK